MSLSLRYFVPSDPVSRASSETRDFVAGSALLILSKKAFATASSSVSNDHSPVYPSFFQSSTVLGGVHASIPFCVAIINSATLSVLVISHLKKFASRLKSFATTISPRSHLKSSLVENLTFSKSHCNLSLLAFSVASSVFC